MNNDLPDAETEPREQVEPHGADFHFAGEGFFEAGLGFLSLMVFDIATIRTFGYEI